MSSSLSTIDGSGGTHNARSVTEAAQHTSEASMAMLQYGLSTLPALFVGTKPALRTKPMATESLRGANGEALVYPLPLVVRNTFIDCPQDRPASFDEFFFERKVASCPVSMISEPGSDIGAQYGDEAVAPPQSSLLRSKTATTVATAVTALATATAMAAAPWRRGPPAEKKSALEEEQLVRPATASTAGPPAAPSVVPSDGSRSYCSSTSASEGSTSAEEVEARLPERPPMPETSWRSGPTLLASRWRNGPPAGTTKQEVLGARGDNILAEISAASKAPEPIEAPLPPGVPSRGSLSHADGNCKPCAFLHSKGCESGKDCQFCHLCDSGEKKRRQKEKRVFFSTVRQMTSDAVRSFGPGRA
eukprot:CAMPEP_0115112704 /NCGR_PEP_ID=MMETSP0227-20121206/40850_1 /TAXON_ID=89957 /ORGANISM="Polarella glacialis, Strain CCMP 1383" /LENGTH=360 /DNA_ID=CAMNT_0002512425 /DNA_START=71 /DNA_END=1153 /DNA_ORIENTATION=-